MNDFEYLQGVSIIKLQTAARMAGLRFKNGAPGFDKAGIIQTLMGHPSILRATIASIKRMEGENIPAPQITPFSLMDDVEAESKPQFMPPVPAIPQVTQTPQGAGFQVSPEQWDNVLRKLGGIHSDYLTRGQGREIAVQVSSAAVAPLLGSIEALKAKVIELEKRAPVVFEVNQVKTPEVTGQHFLFPKMVMFLESQALEYRNIMLIGPASSGKSSAARAFAGLKGLKLYSQPQTVDSFGVLGIETPNKIIVTPFAEAWLNGGVLLIDEISMNGADAIGAMNDALAGGYAPLPGHGYVKRHPDCYVIAGDNSDTGASAKYSSRQVLDGATLDRFIRMEWPIDPALEDSLAGDSRAWLAAVRAIRAYIDNRDIAHVGATIRALIQGRDMLRNAPSLTRLDILEATCRKGILVDSWAQVKSLPEVTRFLQGA